MSTKQMLFSGFGGQGILFSGKFGFGNKMIGIIPANSALAYKIWVISISNE